MKPPAAGQPLGEEEGSRPEKRWHIAVLASIWPYRLVRCGLGGLFVYAGMMKVTDVQSLAETIGDFGLVPESLLFAQAAGLVTLEIAAGIGLLVDIRGSLAAITGMLVLFSAGLAYGIWLGLDIDCGCFGLGGSGEEGHGLHGTLYRDLIMIALCGYLYWSRYIRAARPIDLLQLLNRGRRQEGGSAHV